MSTQCLVRRMLSDKRLVRESVQPTAVLEAVEYRALDFGQAQDDATGLQIRTHPLQGFGR